MTHEADGLLGVLITGCAFHAYLEVRRETGKFPPVS
jgi:hypothetical protein